MIAGRRDTREGKERIAPQLGREIFLRKEESMQMGASVSTKRETFFYARYTSVGGGKKNFCLNRVGKILGGETEG